VPYWNGTDLELIDDIFEDPDFQEPFRVYYPQGKDQHGNGCGLPL
jgi:hypothetical protein